MYCKNCGQAVADVQVYCGECGTPTGVLPPTTQADKATVPAKKTTTWTVSGVIMLVLGVIGTIYSFASLKYMADGTGYYGYGFVAQYAGAMQKAAQQKMIVLLVFSLVLVLVGAVIIAVNHMKPKKQS